MTYEDLEIEDVLVKVKMLGNVVFKKMTLENNQFITSNKNDTIVIISRDITTPPTNLPTTENTTTVALVTINEPSSLVSSKETSVVVTQSPVESNTESANESTNNGSDQPKPASKLSAVEAPKNPGSKVDSRPVGSSSRPGQYIINIPFQSVIAFSPFTADTYNNVEIFEMEHT